MYREILGQLVQSENSKFELPKPPIHIADPESPQVTLRIMQAAPHSHSQPRAFGPLPPACSRSSQAFQTDQNYPKAR